MNSLIHQSISAYRRQKEAQMIFRENTVKIANIFRNFEKSNQIPDSTRQSVQESLFFLMTPLIEVAWADGKIRTKEQESIIQVAEYYGLIDNFEIYSKLMERLSNRPVSFQLEQFWQRIRETVSPLPNKERETVLTNLIQQSQFMAEISQKWMFGYWRGSRMGEHEREILNRATQKLHEINKELKAKTVNYEAIAHNSQIMKTKSKNRKRNSININKLTKIVPLVKVAWADGSVTKREKNYIFDIAAQMGIQPNSKEYKHLCKWLESHPADDLYSESFKQLLAHWRRISPDERDRERIHLISECTRIAEVSGGNSQFPAGGARICDEEIFEVKRIARILYEQEPIGLS